MASSDSNPSLFGVGRRVLLLEPDPTLRAQLESALSREGFEILAPSSAEAAMRALAPGYPLPVAAICDVRQPGLDGFGLCATLRAEPRTARVPVILLSLTPSEAETAKAVGSGADDYVGHPAVGDVLTRLKLECCERLPDQAPVVSTAVLPLPDMARALAAGMRSGRVAMKDGRAWFQFRKGRLIGARFGEVSGEAALARMLTLCQGEYLVSFGPGLEREEFSLGLEGLAQELLPKVRRGREILGGTVSPGVRLVVDFAALARVIPELPEGVNRVIRLFDGVRTVQQAAVECPLELTTSLEVISRLYAGRVLVPVDKDAGKVESGEALVAGLKPLLEPKPVAQAAAPVAEVKPRVEEKPVAPVAAIEAGQPVVLVVPTAMGEVRLLASVMSATAGEMRQATPAPAIEVKPAAPVVEAKPAAPAPVVEAKPAIPVIATPMGEVRVVGSTPAAEVKPVVPRVATPMGEVAMVAPAPAPEKRAVMAPPVEAPTKPTLPIVDVTPPAPLAVERTPAPAPVAEVKQSEPVASTSIAREPRVEPPAPAPDARPSPVVVVKFEKAPEPPPAAEAQPAAVSARTFEDRTPPPETPAAAPAVADTVEALPPPAESQEAHAESSSPSVLDPSWYARFGVQVSGVTSESVEAAAPSPEPSPEVPAVESREAEPAPAVAEAPAPRSEEPRDTSWAAASSSPSEDPERSFFDSEPNERSPRAGVPDEEEVEPLVAAVQAARSRRLAMRIVFGTVAGGLVAIVLLTLLLPSKKPALQPEARARADQAVEALVKKGLPEEPPPGTTAPPEAAPSTPTPPLVAQANPPVTPDAAPATAQATPPAPSGTAPAPAQTNPPSPSGTAPAVAQATTPAPSGTPPATTPGVVPAAAQVTPPTVAQATPPAVAQAAPPPTHNTPTPPAQTTVRTAPSAAAPAADDGGASLNEAKRLYDAGRAADAARVLSKVVASKPNSTAAWVMLGMARFDSGDPRGAEEAATKALALEPKNGRAMMLLASVYLSNGMRQRAEEQLKSYLALEPNGPFASEARELLKQ